MLFNSLPFIYFLLVVFLSIVIVKRREYQYLFLLLCSYFFYYYSSKEYLLLFLATSLLNFYFGQWIQQAIPEKKKYALWIALTYNLGMLFFFKYTNFFLRVVEDVSSLLGSSMQISALHIILPIGISFYTFEAISYLLDVYWGKIEAESSLLHFLLFLAFFPKLIAGPIIRAADLLPQFKKGPITFSVENLRQGSTTLLWGFFKKIAIADNIALLVEQLFASPEQFVSSGPILFAAVAFAVQIYCDFSGYSDIAIGIARMFGFVLPPNFERPFLSKNISEFWRRWHMSLSFFIRDYLYNPLFFSLSRTTLFATVSSQTRMKLILHSATFISFFFIGLWHGADWNFIIFGLFHGIILILYHLCKEKLQRFSSFFKQWLFDFFSMIITFYLVTLALMIFRLPQFSHLFYAVKKYVFISFHGFGQDMSILTNVLMQNKAGMLMLLLFFIYYGIAYVVPSFQPKETILKKSFLQWTLFMTLLLTLLIIFIPSQTSVFIYFQF